MLGTVNPGAIVPSLNRREVNTSNRDVFSAARAAITPSEVISHASRGLTVFCCEPAIFIS
jgi:hypothetical protein